MRINFESFSLLQYRNRALSRQAGEFKSGEKYVKMEADYKKLQRFHNQEIKRMERELARARSETVTVRKYWSGVMDDLDKEHQAEVRRLLAGIERLEKEKLEPVPGRGMLQRTNLRNAHSSIMPWRLNWKRNAGRTGN